MSKLVYDKDYIPKGPSFTEWMLTAPGARNDDQARQEFVNSHNIWDIINDNDDLVQKLLQEKLERMARGEPVQVAAEVGSLVRQADRSEFEAEDLKGLEDVEEHLIVFESKADKQAFQAAMEVNATAAQIGASVDKYSGDTGGSRIITAEVYAVIEALHKRYGTDPGRSKQERSKRAISREIQQDLLMNWKAFGLLEPVMISDVTIDKIIRGVYRHQLKYDGMPSEESFKAWETEMQKETGKYKAAADEREARAAFDYTRKVLIGMILNKYRADSALTQLIGPINEAEFRKVSDELLKPSFDEYNVDFPEAWDYIGKRNEILMVANYMRYPQDISQADMRQFFRKFTPEQRDQFIRMEEKTAREPAAPWTPPV